MARPLFFIGRLIACSISTRKKEGLVSLQYTSIYVYVENLLPAWKSVCSWIDYL